jgi:hypothetical protein
LLGRRKGELEGNISLIVGLDENEISTNSRAETVDSLSLKMLLFCLFIASRFDDKEAINHVRFIKPFSTS